MAKTRDEILHPGHTEINAHFPHAPERWTPDRARQRAHDYDIELTKDHWAVIRALQEYYARNAESIKVRELLDALEEKFHKKGGLKYVYRLLPGGPIAQGCNLAGLEPPAGAVDKGFGSVQ